MDSPITIPSYRETQRNFSYISCGAGSQLLPAGNGPQLCVPFSSESVRVILETGEVVIPPKSACVLPARQAVRLESSAPVELVIVHLNSNMLVTAAAELSLPTVPRMDGLLTNDPLVQNIASMLREIFVNHRDLPNLMAASAASLVAIRLVLRASKAAVNRREQLSPTALKRVYSFVEDHLSEVFRLEDMARSAGCSRFHFARAFRTRTGMTPWQYVTRSRLDRAETLLRTRRELSVAEICHAVGFQDQSHFTRAFKSAFRVTPGTFRREH